jgi:glycerol-3-phosphate cytidylyltransferase
MSDSKDQKNVGITFGAFDLLHAGHSQFFISMGKIVDLIIVGLHVDPSLERPHKNKPVQSVLERYWQLQAINKVEVVIPYETEQDIKRILGMVDGITHYFVGSDYKGKYVTGEEICLAKKIRIQHISRAHDFSSSELRERIKSS